MKNEIEITYAQWKTVTTLGNGNLVPLFGKASTEKLMQLRQQTRAWDPDTKRNVFYILDVPLEDGTHYRMPQEVQNLYGKRYLMALNKIVEAVDGELADREFKEMFAEFNG